MFIPFQGSAEPLVAPQTMLSSQAGSGFPSPPVPNKKILALTRTNVWTMAHILLWIRLRSLASCFLGANLLHLKLATLVTALWIKRIVEMVTATAKNTGAAVHR